MDITPLYVWDAENKQVLIIPKSGFDFNSEVTKRMYVYDSNYAGSGDITTYKYGSYLFSLENDLVGFWEPHDVTYFPAEFRAHLLLLGLE